MYAMKPGLSGSIWLLNSRGVNAFYRRNLGGRQKGLSVAFDLATHPAIL
jgi:hypothetical protein